MTAGAQGEHDSLEEFAAGLRQLRLEADSPTLERLHRETGVSRTVLSEAFNGRKLPSARTVDRIAVACGGDARAWATRRDRLAQRDAPPPAARTIRPAPVTVARRVALVWAAAAFVLGAVVTAAVALTVTHVARGTAPPPSVAVRDGSDPASTSCANDARVVTGDVRDSGRVEIEILWSDACSAAWARVSRDDGTDPGATLSVAIYPQSAPGGPHRQSITVQGGTAATTPLLVRVSADERLCATGAVTVAGTPVELGTPICI
ncbi:MULTISPECIES: helix-turn-helix domain-containing protein [Microbacterium]|uniref:helix-turn-helix domain-containing protein n=1 Tax=Microbacterium TaxID=33882 RepID=UPI0014858AA3|nr:DUF2690 domain-containing protein [Microbacterium sp. 4NA327F11]MCK9915411.1 DUF2690 domain-containing protein [Microbacteriaceae bacterium K1510]